uniref:Uncharacterized protein n=1 Tax=Panagrolaimus sp. JU765 TaxID=591449 RepID=A0AC34QFC8_9BILA
MINDPCYPMVFYDVVGHDEWGYPTTRCNPEHSKMVRKSINNQVLNFIFEPGNLKKQPELLTDSHGRLKTIADDVERVVDEPFEVIQIDDEGNDLDSNVEISVITTKKPKL